MKGQLRVCILILFNTAVIAGLCAQQVYQSVDYGSPGTTHLYSRHISGFSADQIIPGGASTVWDVSDLAFVPPNPTQIISRDEAIDAVTFTVFCSLGGLDLLSCFNTFNSTQQAWALTDTQTLIQFSISDLQRFQRKTSEYLLETFFGFSIAINDSAVSGLVVYHQPDTILRFPVVYGDSVISRIDWGLDLTPVGQNIQYLSHQQRSSKVDGWGILITPFETYEELLRIRSLVIRTDTLRNDTVSIPFSVTQVEYTWYDRNYDLPVMMAVGVMTDTVESIGVLYYLNDQSCVQAEYTVEPSSTEIFLNEDGEATVDFMLDETIPADTYLWEFGDGNTLTATGAVSHTYLAAGTYVVTVTGCSLHCLPLNSCTVQTAMVTVTDTTSAVGWIGQGLEGLRIFPNPASSLIFMDVPDSTDGWQLLIHDQLGKCVKWKSVYAGLQSLDIDDLERGMYILSLTENASGKIRGVQKIGVVK